MTKKFNPIPRQRFAPIWCSRVLTCPGHSIVLSDPFLLIQSFKINWEFSQKKNLKNPWNKMVLKKKTPMLQGNGSIFVLFLLGVKVWNLGLKNLSIRWDKKYLKIWSYEINLIINPYFWISVSLEEFKKKFISADGHGTEVVTKTEFVRRFSESWIKNKYLNRNNCITLMDVSSVRMMTSVAKGDIVLRFRKMSCFNHTVWIINHKWCGITKAPTALLS